MFKNFRIGDLFAVEDTWVYGKNKQYNSRLDNPTSSSVAVVSGITVNNGINYYTDDILDESELYSDCLTISTRGEYSGTVFYHDYPFVLANNILVMPMPNLSKEAKLYIAALLNRLPYGGYNHYPKKDTLKEDYIELPVIENSNPEHKYTVDDIDWNYMRDRITELERDRITELERDRITELDAYLQATGLNDYELTEDDKKVLSLSAKRASDEEGTLEDNSKDEVRFGEFEIETLFHKVDLKRLKKTFEKDKDLSREQTPEYSLPLINAKNGDNGIMYYGRPEDWESDTYCIDIVNDGAISTGNVYPQPQRTGVLYNAYMIKPNADIQSEAVLIYLSKSIEKIIKEQFGYDNKATWDKVKVKHIYLPIKSDGTPDFDYMERYIRAMEKAVIADVVKYKDKVIETTKFLLGEIFIRVLTNRE